MKELLAFAIGMGLAGVIGLAITNAGSAAPIAADTWAIQRTPDALEPGVEQIETPGPSAQQVRSVPDSIEIGAWGITINDALIESVEVDGNSALLRTAAYNQLEAQSPVDLTSFTNCFAHMVTIHRVPESQTTTDVSVTPWWRVQQELAEAGVKAGGFYYFFKDAEQICQVDDQVISDGYTFLLATKNTVLKGLSQ